MFKKLAKMGKKKANKKGEKCMINGKIEYHTIVFKGLHKDGKMYGFIRANKIYTQVVKRGSCWCIPRKGIQKLILGA
jgi:ribosomal protein L9